MCECQSLDDCEHTTIPIMLSKYPHMKNEMKEVALEQGATAIHEFIASA